MDDIRINIKSSRCMDPIILEKVFDEWYEELEPSDQYLIRSICLSDLIGKIYRDALTIAKFPYDLRIKKAILFSLLHC